MHLCGLTDEVWENVYDFLTFRSRLCREELVDLEDLGIRYQMDAMIHQMRLETAFRWKRAGIDHYYSISHPLPVREPIGRGRSMKIFRDMIATMERQKLSCISRDHVRYRPGGQSPIRKRVGIVVHQHHFIYVCENVSTGRIRIL